MDRYLLIAEKPSLAKAIREAYDSLKNPPFKADIFALHGHFMELQEPDQYKPEWGKPWKKEVLPMIPESFKYGVKPECRADYKKLKELIANGNYDCLVNCCDAGREGEAIFWTLINSMRISPKPRVKRLWASDVTTETLGKALLSLLDYGKSPHIVNLRDASLCRIEFDWLVGMNLSRATMLTTRTVSPVGRVKSPTLNIVVQRDLEIQNFVPKDYFEVVADFDKYKGTWFDPKTKETSFSEKSKAEALVSSLGKKGNIESISNDRVITNAPALYSLSELQKEANSAFGFTAMQTLEIAQSLYEKHKILSYPRTDSRVLSTALAKEIPDHLKALKDVPEVSKYVQIILDNPERIKKACSSKKYVDNKKVTDHHAIINTKTKPDLSKLSDQEKKLYILVIKKFVSIFLDPCITNKTVIVTDVSGQKFKTTGSMIESLGYKELYRGDKKSKDEEDLIPAVRKDEKVTVKKIDIIAKQTKPPEPYNDRTLIDAMKHAGKFVDDEKMKDLLDDVKGIGTEATRAGIIEDLIGRKYIERRGKTIKALELGFSTIKVLEGKNVISPVLTAEWESKLREVEDGNITIDDFRTEMNKYIKAETADFLTIKGGVTTSSSTANKTILGSCPICGNNVIMTQNYAMCETYKKEDRGNCNFITGLNILGTRIPAAEFKKLFAGKESKKMNFTSKNGKRFEAVLYLDRDESRIKFKFDN